MSRIQHRINNFDIDLTIYPEIKEQMIRAAGYNLITIWENDFDGK